MTHTYHITGMTCKSCVGKVLNELLKLGDITNASVQLESPQATISMHNHIPLKSLQQAISKAGNYLITHADREAGEVGDDAERKNWWQAYKPIFLIFFYVIALSLIAGNSKNGFDGWTAMRIFMSGFFLCFSFFKFLDLRGFADSYATYDVVAKRFHSWGYIYAFIELALGIAYAVDLEPIFTNCITFIVMSISIIGVLQTVFSKKKIRCACLGAVFNLPMSTVTIIEDGLMITMSGIMIATML